MGLAVPDGRYVTGDVPAEMRVEGIETEIATPTSGMDPDGTPTSLTHFRMPRPDHIPAGPPKISPMPNAAIAGQLQYDFPLLPGVQCRVIFQGDVTADHLEQLGDYLQVACKRLREQQARDLKAESAQQKSAREEKRKGNGRSKAPATSNTPAE